jgi:hypothetical protein
MHQEMKVVNAINAGNIKSKDISNATGYTLSNIRMIITELKDMGWVRYCEKESSYSVDNNFDFRVVRSFNGKFNKDDENTIKERKPIEATFKRLNIKHTPIPVVSYQITPEEAKQKFIELTRHMPILEFKKGVLVLNENFCSVTDSR